MKQHIQNQQEIEVKSPILGLNDTVSIADLRPGEATKALNVDFDRGTIANRRGRVRVGDIIAFRHVWAIWQYRKRNGTEELLCVAGSNLMKYDPFNDVWLGAISGVANGNASDQIGGDQRLGCFGQFADKVFYADGDYQRLYDGSRILDWSNDAGTLPIGLWGTINATGQKLAGDYTFVYTYYSSSLGRETNPSEASAIGTFPANGRGNVTIPANPDWVVDYDKIRLYVTYKDGQGAWFREKEVDVPVGHDLSINQLTTAIQSALYLSESDAELGTEANFHRDPVPPIRFFVITDNRFFGAGDQNSPSSFYWTQDGDPYGWDLSNQQYLNRDDGHPITGLFVLYGRVFAWKRNGPGFQLSPHPLLGYAPQQLPTHHGCESHQGIVVIDNYAIFPDREGFILFNGQQADNISDAKIRNFWNEVCQSAFNYLPRISGCYDNQPDKRRARWFFGTDVAGVGDFQIIMDWRGGSGAEAFHILKHGDTLGPISCHVIEERGLNVVLAGDCKGQVWRERYDRNQVELFSDEGRTIETAWWSAWMGQGTTDMLASRLDIELERSPAGKATGTLTVKVWADGESQPFRTAFIPLTDQGSETYVRRVDLPARYTKRLRVGFEHTNFDSWFSVVKFIVWGVPVGPRLVGV